MKQVTNITLSEHGGRFCVEGHYDGKRYHVWLDNVLTAESDIIYQNPTDPNGARMATRKMSQSKGIGKIVNKALVEAIPALLPACMEKARQEEKERLARVSEAWADHYAKAAAHDLLAMAKRCESWLTAVEKADIEACKRKDHSLFLTDLRAVIKKATTGEPA